MASRFGDITLGDYNVLPLDYKDEPPYTAPPTCVLPTTPDAGFGFLFSPPM